MNLSRLTVAVRCRARVTLFAVARRIGMKLPPATPRGPRRAVLCDPLPASWRPQAVRS